MSTLKANTISNMAGSKSVPTDTVVDGSAKAWVNFNGTGTVAIRAAFNVSSITDNGMGDYTLNFTTAMPDVNYCSQGFSWASGKNASPIILGARASTTYPQTTTTARVTVHDNFSESVLFDADVVNVAIFR